MSPHEPHRIVLPEVWEDVRQRFIKDLETVHVDPAFAPVPLQPRARRSAVPSRRWSADEDRIMTLFYRQRSTATMQGMLTGRTIGMITGRAFRLGLSQGSRSPLPQKIPA